MLNKKRISAEQARYAIANGEFDRQMISSQSKVVVIMTQDWCPQWRQLKSWIYDMETDQDIDVYEMEYNKEEYFTSFMNFKEQHWGNYDVPYLRFYKDGFLTHETNYISRQQFADQMNINLETCKR